MINMHVLISKIKKLGQKYFFIKKDNHSTDINQVLYQIFFSFPFYIEATAIDATSTAANSQFFSNEWNNFKTSNNKI